MVCITKTFGFDLRQGQRYAALCDKQYDADGIAMLFTEDALWESPGLGRFEGREAIRDFFREASGIFSFAIHYSLNGHIEVEGDTARARWYLFRQLSR